MFSLDRKGGRTFEGGSAQNKPAPLAPSPPEHRADGSPIQDMREPQITPVWRDNARIPACSARIASVVASRRTLALAEDCSGVAGR